MSQKKLKRGVRATFSKNGIEEIGYLKDYDLLHSCWRVLCKKRIYLVLEKDLTPIRKIPKKKECIVKYPTTKYHHYTTSDSYRKAHFGKNEKEED